jgi:hypothetical protein
MILTTTRAENHCLIVAALKELSLGQEPKAQAYNPSYSGGKDQEDHSSKPALGK